MRRSALSQMLTLASCFALFACSEGWFEGVGEEVACMNSQCGWEVEQGSTSLTGSWHPRELALAITSTPARLSRLLRVSSNKGCVSFTYVGHIDASARLELRADFNDDGTEDVGAMLPASKWTREVITLRAPADYRSLRVRLHKLGEGRAEIAQFVEAYERSCDAAPVTVLGDGSECASDATCASGRCLLGHCSRCEAGGCDEGQACRDSGECRDGGCAAGVCKRCAKQGTCAVDTACSTPEQCGSHSCVAGSLPNTTRQPRLDAVCGDCDAASDCASGHCVLGRCSECAADADCASGQSCRYLDVYDAAVRKCTLKPTSPLARGALCERDAECAGGLRCAAAPGRAKRCGIACDTDAACAPGDLCVVPGELQTRDVPLQRWVFPRFDAPFGRIATCYPQVKSGEACEVHQQCTEYSLGSCCGGRCSTATVDLTSGECPEQRFGF